MKQYHIGQTVVPYRIEWSRDRSTISLSLNSSMELTVRAPVECSQEDIVEVLDSRQQWLLETLYGLSEQRDPPLEKEFLSGEKLLYRGRRYRLSVESDDVPAPTLSFEDDEFFLRVPESSPTSTKEKRQTVVDWYIVRANQELPERVGKFAEKLGVSNVTTDVRDLSRQWGEFQSDCISLHWRLVLAPLRIQDYVIVHELAHAKHGNHSDAFWNTVGTLVPDYEERREWLRIHGSRLTV